MVRGRTVTIYDVAREANVSPATVSRVLNSQPTVERQLADRVRAAIDRTGYRVNPTGRALRRQVSDVWAAIVPDLQNPFFTGVVSAMEQVALEHRHCVTIFNTREELDRERACIATAVAQRMAGVVIAVTSSWRSDISPLLEANIPTVLIDRRAEVSQGWGVFVDNVRAGQLAAEHLLDRGRRRLACVSGPAEVSAVEERVMGFRRTVELAGLDLPDDYICRFELHPEAGERAVGALLALDPQPDGIYVTNGPFTASCFLALQERGVAIPDDVAYVGADDELWTRMVRPRVTVVDQPIEQIGQRAAELLLTAQDDPSLAGRFDLLAPGLKVREST